MEMKKILVFGIIFLFISITFAPSINFNVVKSSDEDDFVEVTSEACGIEGFGDTTVKLTNEQFQNLEQYLIDFRERLNQTTTREEAVPLFKEAVVELNKYGLLPKGMNVEQAQKLVIGSYQKKEETKLEQKISSKIPLLNQIVNAFCFVAGDISDDTWFESAPLILTISISLFFMVLINYFNFSGPSLLIILFLYIIILDFLNFIPVALFNIILFGDFGSWESAPGSILTIGLLGKQRIEGEMKGVVIGFTGLQIKSSIGERYLLGTSLFVALHI